MEQKKPKLGVVSNNCSSNNHYNPSERKQYCRIAIIGNVDSGKSTIVSVLSKGQLDDGDGQARLKVFNYVHEKQNGRTSSIAQEIIGFNKDGQQQLPHHFTQDKNKYWKDVVDNSQKVVKLLDLAGHEKYLKTTMFGLSGLLPDYCMVIIGSNMGIKKMTKEHLGIAFALNIPLFIVLTKVDICPENILQETQQQLKQILRKQLNRLPIEVKENMKKEELQSCADQMPGCGICPIFQVSSVSGQGLSDLKQFLFLLDNRDQHNCLIKNYKEDFQFDIHEHFLVKGVGIVVSGLIRSGSIGMGQIVNLGPDKAKQFKQVVVKNIHIDRCAVNSAGPGELACFNIKPVKANEKLNRSDFRKGMVLLDLNTKAELIWEFDCEVKVLHHATTIKPNYECVVHCGIIRQTAKLVEIYGKSELQNRDHGSVRMRFKFTPEILIEGHHVLFREGRTKILGTISRVFTEQDLKKEQRAKQELEENKENYVGQSNNTNANNTNSNSKVILLQQQQQQQQQIENTAKQQQQQQPQSDFKGNDMHNDLQQQKQQQAQQKLLQKKSSNNE